MFLYDNILLNITAEILTQLAVVFLVIKASALEQQFY